MDKFWNLAGPATLIERGNETLTDTAIECLNIYSLSEAVVQMRQGFSTEDYSASNVDGPLEWIARHVTNAGEEEAWIAGNNAGTAELGRRSGGVWGPVSFSDTANADNLRFMHSATLNGKLFLAYDSDVNRLHVWDGTSVRRVGLIVATAPTVATLGGAGITATRYYRQRNARQVSGVTVDRSEPSSSVSLALIDDSGWRVTKGAVSGDGETHWEVEAASASAGPWYRIATVAVGTTTYDDTSATIPTTDLSAVIGLYIPPPSAKYLVTDGAVLLMAGAWETSASAGQTEPKQNRVWFTRPLGASDVSDDESIPDTDDQRNWLDIGDGGPITGLAGPNYGEFYVFKGNAVGKLVPTGDITTPYAYVPITTGYGCVDQRVICEGDLAGVPAIFFADTNAAYALSSGGIQCITEGIARDLRQSFILDETAFLAFDALQRILFLQVQSSPGATTGSYRSFTFDVAKQRWSGFQLGGTTDGWIIGVGLLGITTIIGGDGAEIINGAFIEDPDGGKRMYMVGQSDATTGAMRKWGGRVGLDAATAYTTIARYRRAFAAGGGRKVTIGNPTIWYRNPQGDTDGDLTLVMSYIRDDDETRSQTIVLEATDNENGIAVVQRTLETLASADVSTLDVQMILSYDGTSYDSVSTPSIDAVSIPLTWGEPLAQ